MAECGSGLPVVCAGPMAGLADEHVLGREGEEMNPGPNPERVGWLLADVQAWLDAQAADRKRREGVGGGEGC